VKRAFTIYQDDREKTPLLFPAHLVMLDTAYPPTEKRTATVALTVVKKRLTTGDYALDGFESKTLIERKKDLPELYNNLLTPAGRERFVKACSRLRSSCANPILLLEGTVGHLVRTAKARLEVDPWLVVDALQRICLENHIQILYLPAATPVQRRAVGEEVARLLINGAITHAEPPASDLPGS
jgi:ERCC4-type nuclease